MREITTIITRRITFLENKFYLTTNSIQRNYDKKWSNCLYIHFAKEDFPLFKSPELKDVTWGWTKKHFDYFNCILAELPWHGGITFYEESFNLENGKTYVKAGCDYQHLYDDAYRMSDHGEAILETDGATIANEFIKLFDNPTKPDSCQNLTQCADSKEK